MRRLVRERSLREVHSTNEPLVIAGAGTMTLEIAEQADELDAMVVAVGGGSQAVGALTVPRTLRRITGTTPEGAGAAGLAGLVKLGLSRRTVAIVISGANIDADVLQRVLEGRP